jgi:hypothetical protein
VILPYLLRLICLSLAAFFLVHLALGLLVTRCASRAIGRASRLDARAAARFLLILRVLPGAAATLVVTGICVPSYLWLEPESAVEQVGLACLTAAVLGLTILTISMARGLRASRRSHRYIRHCQRVGRRTNLPGEPAPVWVLQSSVERRVEHGVPLLALTGLVRPRLVISQSVLSALSDAQLAAALRHEHAHRVSHDNLKRLAMLLSPGLLPLIRGFDELECAWARFTEFAADDRAVAGDGHRSLFLAAALVRVARLGAAAPAPPLATSLLAGGQDLSARVHRLLHPAPARPQQDSRLPVTGAVLALAVLLAAMLQPAALHGVHQLLEHLIR